MVDTTLGKIENIIRREASLPEKDKTKLLELLGSLKNDIAELSKIHSEEAESIIGFIERSTHEASRKKKNPKLLKLSIDGISESVKEFEVSHPKLVETVNYISSVLANMGI
ncbi:MAG TPA: DUF4404 family protein [Bacteroidota bacterium]|nr:DUF4404 family protein [Bacteroidota bacterium]